MFLLDTNVISDYRKPRPNPGVVTFFENTDSSQMYLCAQVIGEIQADIQKLIDMGNDVAARTYTRWLEDDLLNTYAARILPFDFECARVWGQLNGTGARIPTLWIDRLLRLPCPEKACVSSPEMLTAPVSWTGLRTA